MISEFLALQHQITERAALVGRQLQASRHYVCVDTPFLAASTTVGSLSDEVVDIIVGCDYRQDLVAVRVPKPLFEHGTAKTIEDWVTRQNQAHMIVEAAPDTDVVREKELQLLQDLKTKYKDEP